MLQQALETSHRRSHSPGFFLLVQINNICTNFCLCAVFVCACVFCSRFACACDCTCVCVCVCSCVCEYACVYICACAVCVSLCLCSVFVLCVYRPYMRGTYQAWLICMVCSGVRHIFRIACMRGTHQAWLICMMCSGVATYFQDGMYAWDVSSVTNMHDMFWCWDIFSG